MEKPKRNFGWRSSKCLKITLIMFILLIVSDVIFFYFGLCKGTLSFSAQEKINKEKLQPKRTSVRGHYNSSNISIFSAPAQQQKFKSKTVIIEPTRKIKKSNQTDSLNYTDFIKLWNTHYVKGIPVKPTQSFPSCDKFINDLHHPKSKLYIISMYDPGNCAEIPRAHLKVFQDTTADQEMQEFKTYGVVTPELSDLCEKQNKSLGDSNWRLCFGMPEIFTYGKWVNQRYIYSSDRSDAIKSVGRSCFDKTLSLLFFMPTLDHGGGPRKVVNNLCTGLRLIGKPYIVNARRLHLFDFLFSPDPQHGFFMYHMDESQAKKFYIGPIVTTVNFEVHQFTESTKKYSHIVGASRRAINSQQYFPGMPLKKSNSVIIATGVDERIFKPENVTRTNALIYVKWRCDSRVLYQVKDYIKLPITRINYGSYTEEQFKKSLNSAKYGIVCDGDETQGIAIEEMMAMDVPLFIINPNSVPYFSDQVGVIYSKYKTLYSQFHQFVENVNKGIYKPRQWLVRNLGTASAAVNTMKVFCELPNPWN